MKRTLRAAACAMLAAALLAGAGGCARRPPPPPRELWFYYLVNLDRDEDVARLEPIWRRAAAAGYTHVLLADHKFARLDQMDAGYFRRVRRVRALADSLGLEIVPALFQIGRSSALLAHDPNLAEALPVRDATFEVRGGKALPVTDPAITVGERPDRRDADVRMEGGIARMRDHAGRARLMYRVRVAPWRCYRASIEIRTSDYTGRPLIHVLAGSHPLSFARDLGVARTQEWTRHQVIFNSLDHREVDLWLGSWQRGRGEVDWRNPRIEETGPLNVVRRADTPFTIEGRVEGRDYDRVVDTLLGMSPWRGQFDDTHAPPVIHTRLPDGTRLRASWYMAPVINGNQVMCCISEPAVSDLLRDEAHRVRATFEPKSTMMMFDEIRVLGRDPACRARGLDPGQLLAAEARFCTGLLAGTRVHVWGDMFDPFQNATRDYYLVGGDLARSWEGLDRDVVVVNWNGGRKEASLRFFAGTGHRQVIAGYYDGDPEDIRDWLRAARDVDGMIGVMYTTWRANYDDLEAFARASGAGRRPAASGQAAAASPASHGGARSG